MDYAPFVLEIVATLEAGRDLFSLVCQVGLFPLLFTFLDNNVLYLLYSFGIALMFVMFQYVEKKTFLQFLNFRLELSEISHS